jgi:hypothetical protein
MAKENRTWGYTRIQGAMENLGHEVGRSTIAKVLKEAGLDPAPERQKQTTWKEFLRSHFAMLAAVDFFSVEVWTAMGLVRYQVLFVIRLATREVQIAGIIAEPHGGWMKQMARNLTDELGGFLTGCRYLIHDRSSLFTPEFGMILQSVGIETVRLPSRSPNLNAYAERYVRTIKEGCLDRMILMGEGALRRAIAEFVVHITSNGIINPLITRSSGLSLRHFQVQEWFAVESAWAACSGTTSGKPHDYLR